MSAGVVHLAYDGQDGRLLCGAERGVSRSDTPAADGMSTTDAIANDVRQCQPCAGLLHLVHLLEADEPIPFGLSDGAR